MSDVQESCSWDVYEWLWLSLRGASGIACFRSLQVDTDILEGSIPAITEILAIIGD